MSGKLVATTFFALAVLATGSASAQTVRSGLWQIETKIHGKPKDSRPIAENIAAIRKRMENMRPAQRKRTEAILADWSARGMQDTPEGSRMKLCITQRHLDNFLTQSGRMDGCSSKKSFVKGRELRVKTTCPASNTVTDAMLAFQGNQAFVFQTTTRKGRNDKPVGQTSGTGKWLTKECGKLALAPQDI